MKKILSIAMLSMLMCAFSFSLNCAKTNDTAVKEFAYDVFENESNKRILNFTES